MSAKTLLCSGLAFSYDLCCRVFFVFVSQAVFGFFLILGNPVVFMFRFDVSLTILFG